MHSGIVGLFLYGQEENSSYFHNYIQFKYYYKFLELLYGKFAFFGISEKKLVYTSFFLELQILLLLRIRQMVVSI